MYKLQALSEDPLAAMPPRVPGRLQRPDAPVLSLQAPDRWKLLRHQVPRRKVSSYKKNTPKTPSLQYPT